MLLLKFLLGLFCFVGVLAASGAVILCLILMLCFPPLLIVELLACWILSQVLKHLAPDEPTSRNYNSKA